MLSRRSNLVVYGAIAICAVAFPLFLVNFPEMAAQFDIALRAIVFVAGIAFVAGGLVRRELPLLVIGAGFLIGMVGIYDSIRWMSLVGGPMSAGGIIWMIKRKQAALT